MSLGKGVLESGLASLVLLVVLPGSVLGLVLSVVVTGCQPAFPPPPETARREVVETLHGVEFRDSYRWLEDQQSAETRDWIDGQNAYSEQIIGDSPLRRQTERRLNVLMDRGASGSPRRCQDWEYFSLRRKGEQLSAVYRRLAPEAPTPIDRQAGYERVLDSPAAREGITRQIEQVALSPDCKFLVYSLREGGEDEVELRIRDLEQGEDLSDIFPRALYSSISYTADGKKIYYSHRLRKVGARIRLHTVGTPLSEDEEIFGDGFGPDKFISVSQADQGQQLLLSVGHGWSRSEVHYQDLRQGGPVRPLVSDIDARFSPRFREGMLYLFTNYGADNNRVMRVDLKHPEIQNWEEFLPESEDVMQGYSHINGKIYVNYLRDVSSQIRIFSDSGEEEGQVRVPELSRASVRRFDDESLLLTISSFLQPSRTYKWNPVTGEQVPWDAEDVDFDPEVLSLSVKCGLSRETVRECRCSWSIERISRWMEPIRRCSRAMEDSTWRKPHGSILRPFSGWKEEGCLRWPICEAGASSGKSGIGQATSRTNKMCLTTSLQPRNG